MNISKILKVIGAIVAIAGAVAAVYFLIQKLTDKKSLNISMTTISLSAATTLK